MRFYPFTAAGGRPALAVEIANGAVDLGDLDPTLPSELDAVIDGGADLIKQIAAKLSTFKGATLSVSGLVPRFPLSQMGNFFCVGLNYTEHAKESGHALPTYPGLFIRTRDSLIAAGEPVKRPRESEQLDYEAELVIVVGKAGRRISEANALDHVFGYTLFNDVSVRAYQRKGAQWTPGKNFEKTGAVGPVVVTADALPRGARGLQIMTRLNGEIVQNDNTENMIFDVAKCVSIISEFTTLKPGDLIATGTPSGVGHARTPQLWMKPGDTVEIEIEKIGVLRNTIVDEA
jgi:2-keto-4-pentenoate hydratase/2-oxohepta-3-ene-1,7-dioic acid hydratase in catechol pathway